MLTKTITLSGGRILWIDSLKKKKNSCVSSFELICGNGYVHIFTLINQSAASYLS